MSIIVLDPGHGSTPGVKGYDPGAVHLTRHEAMAALEACLTLKHLLVAEGWTVFLTHDGSQGPKPDLRRRLQFAIDKHAKVFLSVHYDMKFTPPRHLHGVYYAPGVSSYMLAKAVQVGMSKTYLTGTAWMKPSSASRFGGLYIDTFPDALPSIMVELDSIEYAPAKLDGVGRTRLLKPIIQALRPLK